MSHIAFLGVGMIGRGMIEALAARGLEVVAWNRTSERARALEAYGARVAATPAEAVRGAARVHLALSDDVAVDAVLDAAVESVGPEVLVLDHSTLAPAGVRARVARHPGLAYLHAPVFMSPAMCRAAGGIMLVSGEPTRVARALPALEPMTGKVLALGPRPDLAACTKLFGNAMIFAIVGGLADVLAMARAEGVPGRDALALFEHFKPAGQIELRGQRMVAEDLAPSFALAMARKDLGLMLELLERTGEAPAVLGALAARFDARVAEGHGAHDLASIGVPSRVSPSAAEPKG